MWGGSSAHNFLTAVRGDPSAYDAWGDIDSKWSYSNLLSLMKKIEKYVPSGTTANTTERGTSGYVEIHQGTPLPIHDFYTAIADAANCPAVEDYNDGANVVGHSTSQWYITAENKRVHSINSFLPSNILDENGDAVDGRNLDVLSNATVVEIIIKNSPTGPVATGVRFFYNNEPGIIREAYATKKVILCAGTMFNAKLLQLSGIGPTALLNEVGIPVKVANNNVGANIQNHVAVTGVLPMGAPYPGFDVAQAYVDLSGDNTGQANDGYRRFQFITIPYFQYVPRSISLALGFQDALSISILGFAMKPAKVGTVKIASSDPLQNPQIKFNYYTTTEGEEDLARAVQALKVMANISMEFTGQMPQYPPASHYPAPWGPAADDSLLIDDCKNVSLIAAEHSTGSCRMGTSVSDGVVDSNLDVFGVRNLSCCDLSVMPQIPTGNTSFSAYVVGMKKAEIEGVTL